MLPVTARADNVPTDVTFGCALVVRVPVNRLAPIVPEFAYILPEVTFAVTTNADRVPTEVIFGCAAVVNVPWT